MKIKRIVLIGAAVIPFLAGCASQPISLAPVGPEPISRMTSGSKGYLQVFSATMELRAEPDSNTYFHPHSSYDIKDESGKVVRFVPNHASDMDEWPDEVILPAGNYIIVAESTWCGQVSVPLVIQKGKTTVVHLDNNWWPSSQTSSNQLVYLPDGEAVGWCGSMMKLSK